MRSSADDFKQRYTSPTRKHLARSAVTTPEIRARARQVRKTKPVTTRFVNPAELRS